MNLYFENRDDVTRPEDGWPWPWQDSQTTDFAYAFDPAIDKVVISSFGRKYKTLAQYEAEQKKACEDEDAGIDVPYSNPKDQVFPNMKERMNIQLSGKKSGLIVVTAAGVE